MSNNSNPNTIEVNGVTYVRQDTITVDNRPITERVKSYEDACIALGLPTDFGIGSTDLIGIGAVDTKSVIAYTKLIIIARALNKGWSPNWNDSNEYKYYPWFKMNTSGSGLSDDGYDGWGTISSVPARLCFKSSELAEYAGKQFIELYTEYFL